MSEHYMTYDEAVEADGCPVCDRLDCMCPPEPPEASPTACELAARDFARGAALHQWREVENAYPDLNDMDVQSYLDAVRAQEITAQFVLGRQLRRLAQ